MSAETILTWMNRVISECVPGIEPDEWYRIGGQMHTINDDVYFFHYTELEPLLDAMWKAWTDVDPIERNEPDYWGRLKREWNERKKE
jgi:hypothetical protein